MARVLLTGATGLIGRATARALVQAGHEVLAVSRSGAALPGTTAIACNLLDSTDRCRLVAQAGAEHLMHLAWHDGPKDRWVSPVNLDWMVATIALVQEFGRAGGTRAVCAGSCAEYDWSVSELSETSPLAPATPYGATKAGTGLALCAVAPELGLLMAWARIFFVYGPDEPVGRLFGDLMHGLRTGTPVPCSDGLQERDFLHVDDLALALVELLASDVSGPINIASGTTLPVRDLIGEVARQFGRPDLIRFGARARPTNDPPRLAADVTRLTREVGFTPRYDLLSGVAAVLAAGPCA